MYGSWYCHCRRVSHCETVGFHNTFKGSERNIQINTWLFWNAAKNYKYTSKYRQNFCPVNGNIGIISVRQQRSLGACVCVCVCARVRIAFHRQGFLGIWTCILAVPPRGKSLRNTAPEESSQSHSHMDGYSLTGAVLGNLEMIRHRTDLMVILESLLANKNAL